MRQIVGWILILSPFVGLYVVEYLYTNNLLVATIPFVIAAIVAVIIIAGVQLIRRL